MNLSEKHSDIVLIFETSKKHKIVKFSESTTDSLIYYYTANKCLKCNNIYFIDIMKEDARVYGFVKLCDGVMYKFSGYDELLSLTCDEIIIKGIIE